MAELRQADLQKAFRFVGEASRVEGDDPFPPDVLASLRLLIPSDYVFFSELDREGERVLDVAGFPTWNEPEPPIDYWEIRDEHPLCRHHELTRDWRAHKLTDFATERQFRRLRIYREWFRPCGVEHELCAGLDSPLSHTKVFIFDRGPGPDFDERDKALLDLLRPHLALLYRSATDRRRVREATAALEQETGAVVLLDPRDRVVHLTPAARELLARHCGGTEGDLPEAVRSWLANARLPGTATPLVVETDVGALVVRASGRLLLLEERSQVARLTPREHQIMALVTEGKTNAGIAELLCLSPGTVRRHLENVYAKLEVHNRTSAVARLRSAGREN